MAQNVLVMHSEKEDTNVLRLTGMNSFRVHGIQILAKLQHKIFWIDLVNLMSFGLELIAQVIQSLQFQNTEEKIQKQET